MRQPRCSRGTFTESLPAVPARARLTARLRARLGEVIGDELMPAAAAARRYRVSDRTAAAAFTAYADAQLADLDEHQDPVEAAGIDEFRRGIPGPAAGGGEARSQWFTHLVDLSAGGTLGLAQGRTAEAGKGLLTAMPQSCATWPWTCPPPTGPPSPPGTVIADAFHLVKLANRKIDEAFRRLSYRTEHPHEDIGLPRPLHYMLRYNIENLGADHLNTIIEILDGDGDGQQIAAVWIAKEHLRALLALRSTKTHVSPAPSPVRDKLAAFYLWCADHQRHPRDKDPRRHHRKMAATGHRRRADRLFERQSRSTQPHRGTRRQECPRICEPRQPGPPGPHGHHPRRPPRPRTGSAGGHGKQPGHRSVQCCR